MTKPTPYSYVAAGGVRNTRVQPSDPEATLDELYGTFKVPQQLDVPSSTYHAGSKKEKGDWKKPLPYFVGGTLSPQRRDDANVQTRTLLTLDIERNPKHNDTEPPAPVEVAKRLRELGGHGWVYTSIGHTSKAPRYRVVLPLGEPIGPDPDTLRASTQAAAKKLGIEEWCTPESWVLSQPMYLPVKLKGGAFYQAYVKGKAWGAVTGKPQVKDRPKGQPADIPDERPDPLLQAIKAAGLYLQEDPKHKGKHYITCPFIDQHEAENDTQTVYYEPHHDGNPRAAVKCFDTAPDEDGVPHLTYGTLVRWLKDHGHITQDQQSEAGVLDDYDAFDTKANLGNVLVEEPVAREWAVDRFAPIGKVTVLAGPGGVSKSMLMLHVLLYLAMGQRWAEFDSAEPLRSLYVSYEDDRQELHKRVHTLAAALREVDDGILDALYDVNGTIRNNIRMFAADDEAAAWLLLTKPDRFLPPERSPRVEWLVGYLKAKGIKLLCLDPAVYTHQLEENSVADMATYMQTLTYIAKQAGCAVVVLHHMHKAGGWAALDDINQGSLRGASSFADNARSVAVIVSMPIKEAHAYGLDPSQETTSRFAVLKHVKHNYSAPMPQMVFERKGALLVHRPDIRKLDMDEVNEAKENQRNASLNKKIEILAGRALEVLLEYSGPATQNQIGGTLKVKPLMVKQALEYLEQQDYVEMEEGPNRSRLCTITALGKRAARAGKK